MDLAAELEHIIEGMSWEDIAPHLEATIQEMLADIPMPPSSPPSLTPPPLVPAGLSEGDPLSQPAESQSGGFGVGVPAPHMMAAPNMYNEPLWQEGFVPLSHLHSQPANNQGQLNDAPAGCFSDHIGRHLIPVGVLNGDIVYGMPAGVFDPVSAPQMNNVSNSNRERQCVSQQAENQPYIKRPPNAFMLYLKEQRPNVAPEIRSRGSGAVNAHLGEKWNSLTEEEQAKYYDRAVQVKRLHEQLYPEWSAQNNYGKRRKRRKSKAPTTVEGNALQIKRLCVTPSQTAVTDPLMSRPCEMNIAFTQTEPVFHPNTQTADSLPPDNMHHLPNLSQVADSVLDDFLI